MVEWGRNVNPNCITKIGTILLLIFAPLLTMFMVTCCLEYDGNIGSVLSDLYKLNFIYFPKFNLKVFLMLCTWILFQYILALLPDRLTQLCSSYKGGFREGQHTPAGNILTYNINGLQSWMITHILFFVFSYMGIIDPAIIAKSWAELFVGANVIGYCFCTIMYIKARVSPTHPEDDKYTGNFFYDYMMGIEFNPAIFGVDVKLFWNGRPGIIAWTLINASFTALQYQKYGLITDSILVLNFLQGLYVLDFFWNENWYLKTIDIAHDHFGWYFAWGDAVWLPFCYTLQAVYLASNPIVLGNINSLIILLIGISGYILFRWTNYQKDDFRSNPENCIIWGTKAKYIECEYKTKTGIHTSKLLISGFWRLARHMNYTGDIILSTAYCLVCGFNHITPYFYAVYMITLLIIRCYRDEQRCKLKYSQQWTSYCNKVKYRLIPHLY